MVALDLRNILSLHHNETQFNHVSRIVTENGYCTRAGVSSREGFGEEVTARMHTVNLDGVDKHLDGEKDTSSDSQVVHTIEDIVVHRRVDNDNVYDIQYGDDREGNLKDDKPRTRDKRKT